MLLFCFGDTNLMWNILISHKIINIKNLFPIALKPKNDRLFNSVNGEETFDDHILSSPQNTWIYFLAEN